jgi:hypothetical protein
MSEAGNSFPPPRCNVVENDMLRRFVLVLGRRSCTTASSSSSRGARAALSPVAVSEYTTFSLPRLWRQCGERYCGRLHQRSRSIASKSLSSSSILFAASANNDNNKVLTAVDPTAKRPTRKCDPFGLNGKSLSYDECNTWMSTLEKGWTLIPLPPPSPPPHSSSDITIKEGKGKGEESSQLYAAAAANANPTFLQKHYYHKSFLDASQFITHVSSVATNNNHYPHLSFERILISSSVVVMPSSNDKEKKEEEQDEVTEEKEVTEVKLIDNNTTTNRRRQVMGWIVRSTIQCSTYRPLSPITTTTKSSTTLSPSSTSNNDDDNNSSSSRGLTYHDFHLALCIDVEVKRSSTIQSLLLHLDR